MVNSGVVAGGGGGGIGATPPLSDNFFRGAKVYGGAETRNCQCEILYKICEVRPVNKLKNCRHFYSYSIEQQFLGMSPCYHF